MYYRLSSEDKDNIKELEGTQVQKSQAKVNTFLDSRNLTHC